MSKTKKRGATRASATPSMDSYSRDSSLADSVLSPHSVSRLEEKDSLIHLNDRLANYINRVRQLEKENRHLDVKIKETEVLEGREKQNMRDAYDREISELRKMLDDVAKAKAAMQIAHDRMKVENESLKARVAELERMLADLERRLDSEGAMVHNLTSRNTKIESENSKLTGEIKKLKSERDEAVKKEALARRQLEEETVLRVDTENRLQSAKEQLEFTRSMHAQTIAEMKEKRETEISMASRDIEDDFQCRIQEELNSMRVQLDAQLDAQRRHLEGKYNAKLAASETSTKGQSEEMRRIRDEMLSYRGQMETVTRERASLNAQIEALKRDLASANDAAMQARRDFDDRMRYREEELARLQRELSQMLSDNQDLMDIKIKLDAELNAYRALLEDEETRLNMSSGEMNRSNGKKTVTTTKMIHTPGQGGDGATPRGQKRRRVDIGGQGVDINVDVAQWDRSTRRAKVTEFTSINGLSVSEHDAVDGAFIKVTNDTNEEIAVGGWKLQSSSTAGNTLYKFTSKTKIAPKGGSVTIWSSNAAAGVHSPPTDMQMKTYNWPVGEKVHTVLSNKDDEEIAWRTTDGTSSYDVVFGDFANREKDEKCSIM